MYIYIYTYFARSTIYIFIYTLKATNKQPIHPETTACFYHTSSVLCLLLHPFGKDCCSLQNLYKSFWQGLFLAYKTYVFSSQEFWAVPFCQRLWTVPFGQGLWTVPFWQELFL